MNQKTILGGIAGGVAFFFLGWLIYGMLMKDFMAANTNSCFSRPEAEFVWWALIVSNLAWGFILALIFSWSNISSVAAGVKAAAIYGLLIGICYDMLFYSMTTMYSSMTTVIVDVIVGTIMSAIGGAVIAAVMIRKKGAAA
jgi:hypothetical protein